MIVKNNILVLTVSVWLLAFHFTASANPGWWTNAGVLNDKEQNENAAVNRGQVKTIAKAAMKELKEHLPGGVGDMSSPNGTGYKLTHLLNGLSKPQTVDSKTNDSATMNFGQLKGFAKPVYDRLYEVGYQGPPLTAGQKYPWDGKESQAPDDASVNVGQVKVLFSFDLTLDANGNGIADWTESKYDAHDASDSNGNGIPDWIEAKYNVHDALLDTDGDGIPDWREYLASTDPKDFYNGKSPVFTIVSGDGQGDFPGETLANPYVVKVANQAGIPNAAATVKFSISSGGGSVSALNGGGTDPKGLAKSTLTLPRSSPGTVVHVVATYRSATLTFTATIGDANAPPEAPGKPKVTGEHGSPTTLIEWEDRSNNETAFYVERTDDGAHWTRVATLPANTTSYTDTGIPDEVYFYRIIAHNESAR